MIRAKILSKLLAKFLQDILNRVVHWRRNLFKVPSGKAGRTFVHELSRLFQAYAESSALEGVAMKSAMIMPALLLQKPHSRSKTKEHVKHLERRLQLWKDGNLNSLLDEGSAIQSQFDRECRGKIKPTDQISRTFSKFMMEGKVRSALRLISEGNNGQPLRLDNLVENGNTNNPPETDHIAWPSPWLATLSLTIPLHLWPELHCGTCTYMLPWWIPLDSSQ